MTVPPNYYDIGNEVVLSVTFVNASGMPVDPTTVTLRVKDPNGIVTSYTGGQINRISTGVYNYTLSLGTAGFWYYRFEAAGAVIAAGDATLFCQASPVLT